jgi:transcriptional regulator with XRE-family HTH domain
MPLIWKAARIHVPVPLGLLRWLLWLLVLPLSRIVSLLLGMLLLITFPDLMTTTTAGRHGAPARWYVADSNGRRRLPSHRPPPRRADLAQRIGTYRQHVTAWETGTRRPSPALLVRIAAAVGVDPLALTAAGKRPSLADLRARKGLSQIRVAELLGIPRSTYSLIERGGILHEAVVARLAETLDVTVEEVAAAHARPRSRPGTRDR